jgi:hypothetical protein
MVIPKIISALGINSIVVKRNEDFGYWEVNPVEGVANLRKMNVITLPAKYNLTVKTEYYTIMDYLKEELKYRSVKEVIEDRKVIFSRQAICEQKGCKMEAHFIVDGKKLCEVHSGIKIN